MQKKSGFKSSLNENKTRRHAEFISASHLVYNSQSGEILKQVQDNNIFYNSVKGFTLIELLVVVLIIGILAAVALPQYKMAVAKSRVSTLLGMMDAVKQAQETYFLANGSYANDIDELSVSLPGQQRPGCPSCIDTSGVWIIIINASTVGVMGSDYRVPGVKIYFFHDHTSHGWKGKHLCYARMSNDTANKVCQNLTNRKTPNSNNGPNTDNIYFFN